MLNGSLMDYGLPTAEMVPPFVTSRLETPSPMNPLGVKGMGEGPTVGTPPAIVNAVIDALEPFGVCHIEMPLTPERVLRAINEGRAVQSAG
jgi:carbon-monoxide dehydrogenase large subunit